MEKAGSHTHRPFVLQRTAMFSNSDSNLVLKAISDQVLEKSVLTPMTKQTYFLCNLGPFIQNPATSQKNSLLILWRFRPKTLRTRHVASQAERESKLHYFQQKLKALK